MIINYYEILKVSQSATASEIQKAFRRESIKFHPDKQNGKYPDPESLEKFHLIQKAKEILLNVESRTEYDKQLNSFLFHQEKKKQMTEKQQRMQEDLEERERIAKKKKDDPNPDGSSVHRNELGQLREQILNEKLKEKTSSSAAEFIPNAGANEQSVLQRMKARRKK